MIIVNLARFLSFFYAETLYDIPMTVLASRLTPELEEINFSTPVLLQKVLTTASRDVNGEMNEKKPTDVAEYSMAQQFFFRRGPSERARLPSPLPAGCLGRRKTTKPARPCPRRRASSPSCAGRWTGSPGRRSSGS